MKRLKLQSPLISLLIMLMSMSLACFCSEAQARGGWGGVRGGGGFSGGSFRSPGVMVQGPRGVEYSQTARMGEVARGPQGGVVARGPKGRTYARGPEGNLSPEAAKVRGPYTETVPSREQGYIGGAHFETVPKNWGAYYGPGHGGPTTPLAVGSVVGALPGGAVARTIAGQRYYYYGGAYYLPCYLGTEVNYCVVSDPTQ
jgi:hypothetical protein